MTKPLFNAFSKLKRHPVLWKGGIVAGVCIIIFLLVSFFVLELHAPADSKSDDKPPSSKRQQSGAQYYSSADDKFKIAFPYAVNVQNDTVQFDPGTKQVSFPYRIYSSTNRQDTQVYLVFAYEWPAQNTDFANMDQPTLKATLTSFIKSDLQAYDATIISTEDTQQHILSGHTFAEQAYFSFQSQGHTVYGHIRSFTVGNYEYDIEAQGITESDFDSFADSFEFTGTVSDTLSPAYNGVEPGESNEIEDNTTYYNDSCSTDLPGCTHTTDGNQNASANSQIIVPSGN